MDVLFESFMLCSFAVADFVWLTQIWKSTKGFSSVDKLRSVTFTVAFLLSFFLLAWQGHLFNAIICLIGYVTSQFTVAVVFHENYKEMEIPYE